MRADRQRPDRLRAGRRRRSCLPAARRAIAALTVMIGLGACGGSAAPVHPAATRARPATTTTTTTDRSAARTRTIRVADRTRSRPLAGRVVGVDPGHNGRNYTDPGFIDHQIWNGREYENCDTTGTETDGGYTEPRFTWNVARALVADLHREGARVVLTRHGNKGIGPCVTRRAQIFNRAHVAVAISIHADGGPPGGRGFAILEPVADGINNRSLHGSHRFARILRARFRAGTGMPVSTYDGVDGLQPRNDLAGENLNRHPYALLECGNMRNATDAALLTSSHWQHRAAAAIARAITRFLAR